MKIDKKLSPEGSRGIQNEVLEPSRAPLGGLWAQGGRQERPRSSLGGAPAGPEESADFRAIILYQ